MDVEAPASGILKGIKAGPNDVVPVAQIIAYITEPGEELAAKAEPKAVAPPAAEGLAVTAVPVAEAPVAAKAAGPTPGRVAATPVARKIAKEKGVTFHTDAVQTYGKVPIDVAKMKIDLLSLSSHKIHGPKGAGALYAKRGVAFEPLAHGGGHERGLRSGTENVAGIVGLGKAAELAKSRFDSDTARLIGMRDRLI